MLTPQGGRNESDDSSDGPQGVDHVSWLHTDGDGVSQGQRAASVSVGRGGLDCAETTVDGVLLDIALPELDGFEVLRQLRPTHPTLPVVMMTAVEALDRAMAAVESGAQDYLLKPFDGTRLRQIVDRWFVIGSGQSESPIGR